MASQITANLPALDFPKEVDYPTQEDWAAFSAAAELNFGILGGDWSTQMQLWKTEANAMSTELNNSADIAQSIANYQGDWTSQGYTLGQTVSIGEVYYICKLTHATGQNPTAVGSLYWNLALGNWSLKADKIEVALKIDKDISPYSSKPTPIDADLIPLSDSASSFEIKKLSWANIKATLKTYFDTLYASPAYVDGKMVLGTAVTASGTAIDFTGIPSWVKRITVMFNGISTNGSSPVQIQLGDSGGIENSGYTSLGSLFTNVNTTVALSSTTGFSEPATGALTSAGIRHGSINILNISLDTWVSNGTIGNTGNLNMHLIGGTKSLSAKLDRIRITTVNGTDTFDAGQINIMYEG